MSVQHQIDRLIALRAAEWYENVKDGTGSDNTDFVNWLADYPFTDRLYQGALDAVKHVQQ